MAKRGAKNKYETCCKPYLSQINEKVRQGVIESEIAKSLGISVASLNNYRNKYPEFAEALSKDKGADVLQDLVNAGIKSAQGFFVEEEDVVYGYDKDGNSVVRSITTHKRWIPANPNLNKFYTMNYGKKEGFTNDPQNYELAKAKQEFLEKLQKAENWDKDL